MGAPRRLPECVSVVAGKSVAQWVQRTHTPHLPVPPFSREAVQPSVPIQGLRQQCSNNLDSLLVYVCVCVLQQHMDARCLQDE